MNHLVRESGLRKIIESTLIEIIPPSSPVALFDFPNYSNVGDSAIWLGVERYLTGNNHKIIFADDLKARGYSLPKFPTNVIICIHGGGNFSDLYPKHQKLREKLLSAYPNNRIVQLPQSLYFKSVEDQTKISDAMNRHKDFHLIVRDYESRNIAAKIYNGPTYLCPDMALYLQALPKLPEPQHIGVGLLRTDIESTITKSRQYEGLWVCDWLEEQSYLGKLVDITSKFERLVTNNRMNRGRRRIYTFAAQSRLKRGCGVLSSGKWVVTDRLHGHILCTMMDIPHVVLDNSYGKIANFRRAWGTGDNGLCRSASSVEEAVSMPL